MKIDYKSPEVKVVMLEPRHCMAYSNEAYGVKDDYDPNNEDEEDW